MLYDENNQPRSLAVVGVTPRGWGVALSVDVFTTSLEDALALTRYAVEQTGSLQTSLAVPLPNHLWLWMPYELEKLYRAHFERMLEAFQGLPTFYFLHAAFMEKNVAPSGRL